MVTFVKQTIAQPALVRWTSPEIPNLVGYIEGGYVMLVPLDASASFIVRVPISHIGTAIDALTTIGTELGKL